MSRPDREFKEGQRVWHRGRPATFLYYAREGAATIRFEGHRGSTVVSGTGLSAEPSDESEG